MKPTPRLVHHFLERSAELFPRKIAVVQAKRRVDFAWINGWANRLARVLIAAGVRPEDRIVLLCENSIEHVFCYYGILKSGATAVALDTDIKPEGLAILLKELEPKALIASPQLEKTVQALDPSLFRHCRLLALSQNPPAAASGSASSFQEELAAQTDSNPGVDISPQSCSEIIYTSGSQGKPKGVMLSHANIEANTRSIVEYLSLTPDDVQMVVLPFFYVMGRSLLNTHFAAGGSIVINNAFAYTAAVLRQMAEEGVTGFSGVPSTYAHLLFRSPLAAYRDKLPKLRYVSQAGGHMPTHIKLELLKILPPHTRLFVMYGATEASARLTYVPPERLTYKIDSIGIPIAGVTLSVISPDGKILGPGETGELVARGDNIMLGYFKDGHATKKALGSHGYHTGDLGYRDNDNYFFITGRKDDQLKIAGHRVDPQEIEDKIIESGLAAECLIFGVPDPLKEQRLAGLAVPVRPSRDTLAAILKFCAARLPRHKVPDSLKLVEAIPKMTSGKPDRKRAIQIYMHEVHE